VKIWSSLPQPEGRPSYFKPGEKKGKRKMVLEALKSRKNLFLWLPIVLIATPYLLFIVPQYLGLEAYIVESGSMAPEMPTGSVIYMQEIPADRIKTGDVIVFTPNDSRLDAERVTHRVTDTREGNYTVEFKTKGDANPSPDPGWTPSYKIEGKRAFSIPHLGYLIKASRSPLFITAFIILPSILLMKGQIETLLDQLKDKKRERTPTADKKPHL